MYRVVVVGNVVGQVVRDSGISNENKKLEILQRTGVKCTAVSLHNLQEHCVSFFLVMAEEQTLKLNSQYVVIALDNPETLKMV